MILSMTGYGKAVAELPGKKVYVEIKSLNSKSLDLAVKMPTAYREKEMEMRAELAAMLVRGKVDVMIWIEKNGAGTGAINAEAFKAYCEQIGNLSKELSLPLPTDWFQTVLRLPEVLNATDSGQLDDDEWRAVHEAVRRAADELTSFRRQEGVALEAKFREKVANISSYLAAVEPYEKERVQRIRQRIEDALDKALDVDYDKNRLEQELIYYIEKLDINEEKQRLTNHLRYFIDTLEGDAGQGKKLGFIAQEMGREINTLGSKSNHAEMQNLVVRMKDELEQIKEQVLNVM